LSSSSQHTKEALDLELFPAEAVTFIPVYLSGRRCSIRQSNHGDALHLSPAPTTIDLPEPLDLADFPADGNHFLAGNLPDDLDAWVLSFGRHFRCSVGLALPFSGEPAARAVR
jgi:hypothetical protein